MAISNLNGTNEAHQENGAHKSAVLHRDLHHEFPEVSRGEGNYLILNDGRKVFDASGGAAVACVGVRLSHFSPPLVLKSCLFYSPLNLEYQADVEVKHGNARVNTAMIDQISKVSYCASTFFKTSIVEEAARMLVNTTNGHMTRAYIVNSGQSAILIL